MQNIPPRKFPRPKPAPHNAIYMETSVLIAYNALADDQRTPTRKLWQLMDKGKVRFMASRVAAMEANRGYEQTRELFEVTFPDSAILPLTKDVIELSELYISAGVLTSNHEDDARHVAVCTLAGIQWLLSWNFHHVRPARSAKFNRINHLHDLPYVHIVTPDEYLSQYGRHL